MIMDEIYDVKLCREESMMISALIFNLVLLLQPIYLPMIMHEYEQPCFTPGTALEKAIAYLDCEFNDEVGLIRESPDQTKDGSDDFYWRYWLTTDNRVAQYALKAAGSDELASTLADTLRTYGDQKHGIIEVLDGKDIDLPPHTEVQCRIDAIEEEDAQIWYEQRTGHLIMNDWEKYADLLLYGALDAFHSGETFTATVRYEQAIGLFDGTGFADKFFCEDERHLHPTYKLALALYTAQLLDQPVPEGIMVALLAQQNSYGGFYTLYQMNGDHWGNTSTEPTAHAVLALSAQEELTFQSDPITPAQCKDSNPLPDHPRGTAR